MNFCPLESVENSEWRASKRARVAGEWRSIDARTASSGFCVSRRVFE